MYAYRLCFFAAGLKPNKGLQSLKRRLSPEGMVYSGVNILLKKKNNIA